MNKYTVELTATAECAYRTIGQVASRSIEEGGRTDSKVTLLQTLDVILDVHILRDPFNKKKALSSPLYRVFWVAEGRLRVFYTASLKPKTLTVVHIAVSDRKRVSLKSAEAIALERLLGFRRARPTNASPSTLLN